MIGSTLDRHWVMLTDRINLAARQASRYRLWRPSVALVRTPVFAMGIIPVVFYSLCFFLLTYPALLKFSSHYYADGWDGLQHVWGIWWVDRATTDLVQLPWQTDYLFYPNGVSFWGHALSPLNGLIGTLALQFTGLESQGIRR